MKFLLILMLTLFSLQKDNLVYYRNLLEKAEKSENEARLFYSETEDLNQKGTPVHKAYFAMATFMMSKYVTFPLTKLNYFNKGKTLLENAITLDKNNIELIYLRFTVQTNVPGLLGYAGNIEKDKRMLIENLKMRNCKDRDLIFRIAKFLLQCKYLSETEKKQLTNVNVF